jgi:hypothetical protein
MYYLLPYVIMFLHSVFCILYYLCITVYVLFLVYVTLPPGIGTIAVGNIYIYIYIYIYSIFQDTT